MNEYLIVYVSDMFRETYVVAESEDATRKKFKQEVGNYPIIQVVEDDD
ncbi:hypothetical protein AB8U03_13440 [Clostridium sp. Mt-5]|uniref:Phage protein n=1 Tax=Clostridium moutaii TaxID=3240932 RepID=A0ABV4BQX0_9CLOT